MSAVAINPDLLAILCCPDTKQAVAIAPDALVQTLNAAIDKGTVTNRANQPVTQRLDGGLLRADRALLYPIRENIPVLLIDQGIPVSQYL
ncbi:MAG: hypothetical protein U0172_09965 [Nitrospiraceae bacterium]